VPEDAGSIGTLKRLQEDSWICTAVLIKKRKYCLCHSIAVLA